MMSKDKQNKQPKPQEPKLGSVIPQRPHQVIFLNGPPGCGKDTAAMFAYNEYPGVRRRKFANPLKDAVHGLFQVLPEEWHRLEAVGSLSKDQKSPRFMDHSYREVLIWLASVTKHEFGDDFFGFLLADEMKQSHGAIATIITDSGFAEEAWPIIRAYGQENCHIIRIHREGCTFDNDSRTYWSSLGKVGVVTPKSVELAQLQQEINDLKHKINTKKQTKILIEDLIAIWERKLQKLYEKAEDILLDSGGMFNSPIAIVAEAPGEREVALRQPLIGGSGRVLFDALRKEGMTRNHVYITNVVKRKLVSTHEQYAKPKAPIGRAELDHWRYLLLDELSYLPNLKYIVALGNFALHALTGEQGITNWRGSVIPATVHGKAVQVLATFNPALIIREPKNEIVFKMDLGKLTRLVNGTFAPPRIHSIINPTYTEAMDYIRSVTVNNTVPVAVDIETIANETACVGLANKNDEGMCINFRTAHGNRYSLEEEREIRLALQQLLATHPKVIAQNGTFDSYWMGYKDRIRWRGCWFDTMLAHHLLYPGLPHNLGFLTAQYTDHPYYKDDGKTWKDIGDINQFWNYNVTDCCITRIVALKQLDELRTHHLDKFFFNHVMRLQPHLVRMTVNGIKCDAELKQTIAEQMTHKVEQLRTEFLEYARKATCNPEYECNPNSPKQLGTLFFKDLKLVGRGGSTDVENRKRMRGHAKTSSVAKDMLDKLDEYMKRHKMLSTYFNCGIDPDGRIRCEYSQIGVSSAPGRLSSKAVLWGTGMNFQNQPEEAKVLFEADPGYELTYFDASQIEARIVAWKARIPKWKEQFELARLNPGAYDAHCALAADMWKMDIADVPKFDTYPDDWPLVEQRGQRTIRYLAKRARHGLNYRMGPDRLATTSGLSIRDAEVVYRLYHRTTPEIMQWWDRVIDEVRRERCLYNAFGRRWALLERFDEAALESVIAFYPQSTAGDHIARCIYLCHDDPEWPSDARMLLNIHDALVAIHRPEDREIVKRLMKKHGETPIIIDGEELIVPVEFARSVPGPDGVHRWSTLQKIKEEKLAA
ncbi:unnamed protein product [Sphagnum balticum]